MTTTSPAGPLLRPLRLRDRRRSVPGLEAAARRGPPLLEREVRVLRAQPLGGRRHGPARLEDLHLGPWVDPGADPGRHRDAAGDDPHGGPTRARCPPLAPLPGVHAEEDASVRARRCAPYCADRARPAGRGGWLRLHRRPGRVHADAGHRHAAGHPRAGPGGDPRADRRRPAARGGSGVEAGRRQLRAAGGHVRRLHRLAGRPPVRRPHDRADATPSSRTRRASYARFERDEFLDLRRTCWPPPATRRRPD